MSQPAQYQDEDDGDGADALEYTYRDLENALGIAHSTAQRLLRKCEIEPTKVGLTSFLTADEFRRAIRTYGTPRQRVLVTAGTTKTRKR